MYDFCAGKKVSDFVQGLEDTFPFFRMFLDDSLDAEVQYFLHTKKADNSTIRALCAAIAQALERIRFKYPETIPPENGIINVQGRYEKEITFIMAIAHLVQMLIHLKASICAFAKVIEFGGNPTTL